MDTEDIKEIYNKVEENAFAFAFERMWNGFRQGIKTGVFRKK